MTFCTFEKLGGFATLSKGFANPYLQKSRLIWNATKKLKQVYGIQHNAPTSLIP